MRNYVARSAGNPPARFAADKQTPGRDLPGVIFTRYELLSIYRIIAAAASLAARTA